MQDSSTQTICLPSLWCLLVALKPISNWLTLFTGIIMQHSYLLKEHSVLDLFIIARVGLIAYRTTGSRNALAVHTLAHTLTRTRLYWQNHVFLVQCSPSFLSTFPQIEELLICVPHPWSAVWGELVMPFRWSLPKQWLYTLHSSHLC